MCIKSEIKILTYDLSRRVSIICLTIVLLISASFISQEFFFSFVAFPTAIKLGERG